MLPAYKPRRKCCFCLPEKFIKLLYIWIVVPVVAVVATIMDDPRTAMMYLPTLAVCIGVLITATVVFFHPGFDTYGTRIALFWFWLNGFIGANIYSLFLNSNSFWWNSSHYSCLDQHKSMYSKEYVNCMEKTGNESSVGVFIGLIIDSWMAFELYRWA